jgi:hypothetical protein
MPDAPRCRYSEHYGFSTLPAAANPAENSVMMRAVAYILNGDSTVSASERQYALGLFAAKGFSPEVIAEAGKLLSAPGKGHKAATAIAKAVLAAPTLKFATRGIIADAIRAASTDGYAPGEHDAVMELAGLLGLSDDVVKDIVSARVILFPCGLLYIECGVGFLQPTAGGTC